MAVDIVAGLGDWASGRGPLHRKLAAALQAAIEAGRITAGERLPSERSFAQALVVSRSTVVAAYDALRAAGVVDSRQGSGTYVLGDRSGAGLPRDAETPGAFIFQRLLAAGASDGPPLISFAHATIPGHPAIVDAIRSFAPEELAELLTSSGYVPQGLPALREAIARLLDDDGLPTSPGQVLVTTGAHQAIGLCAGLLVRPGDLVVVECPTFAGTVDAFAAAGARFEAIPVDERGAGVAQLESILHRTAVAAIYVMPTFHNPTGTVLSGERRRRLAEVAGRAAVPVIEDNALAHAALGPPPPFPPVAAYPGAEAAPVISIGSLSKTLWGGLRVGWLRAPEPWLSRLARRKAAADLGSALFD